MEKKAPTLVDYMRLAKLHVQAKWASARWFMITLRHHYHAMRVEQLEQPRPHLEQWREHAKQIMAAQAEHREWKYRLRSMTDDERDAEIERLREEKANLYKEQD